MSDVNWDSVGQPKKQPEAASSGPLGTIGFGIFVIGGILLAGAYFNMVTLGDRVRDLVARDCADPTCVVELRGAHGDCFDSSVSYGLPGSMADFQTDESSGKLGIGTVDLEQYRACVLPPKPATLAEQEGE